MSYQRLLTKLQEGPLLPPNLPTLPSLGKGKQKTNKQTKRPRVMLLIHHRCQLDLLGVSRSFLFTEKVGS